MNMIHDTEQQIAYLVLKHNGEEVMGVAGYKRQPIDMALVSQGAHVEAEIVLPDVPGAIADEAVIIVTGKTLGGPFADDGELEVESHHRTLRPGDSISFEFNSPEPPWGLSVFRVIQEIVCGCNETKNPPERYRYRFCNGSAEPERLPVKRW